MIEARSISHRADEFDVDALVVPHPELSCPMIVTRGPLDRGVPVSLPPAGSSRFAAASLAGGLL